MKQDVNFKVLRAVSHLANSFKDDVGFHIGNLKLTKDDKKYLLKYNLIYINPVVYKQSYVDTWIGRRNKYDRKINRKK